MNFRVYICILTTLNLLLKVVSLLLHGVEALLLQSADRTHQPLPGPPLERQIQQRDLFESIDY